jgi:hypothetical protein
MEIECYAPSLVKDFSNLINLFILTSNFATYNANKNTNNQFVNINYGSSLEGVWNFIYISYSSVE